MLPRMSAIRGFMNSEKNLLIFTKMIAEKKTPEEIASLIEKSIDERVPRGQLKYFRIHTSGDFFHEKYFKSWIVLAENNPRTVFYGYTKMVPMVLKYENKLPDNLKIALSYGSFASVDKMTDEYGKIPSEQRTFKIAYVVASEEEAQKRNLPVDYTDELAAYSKTDFALVEHGTFAISKKKSNKKK